MGEDGFPALAALTGPDTPRLLAQALPEGTTIERLEAVQITGAPGRRTTVRYDADLRTAQGGASTEILVASVDRRGVPDGARTVAAAGEQIAVWPARDDPWLPALARALDRGAVVRLLGGLGVEASSVRLVVRAYRPGRRAVVEVVAEAEGARARLAMTPAGLRPKTDEHRLFLKVMRPGDEERLADAHGRMGEAVPVPRVLGCHPEGLLVTEAIPGRTLRSCLRRGQPVPRPGEVVALAVAPGDLGLADRDAETADERVAWSTGLLSACLPDQRARLDGLSDRLFGGERQPLVTIHGDFHEGQILVRDGVLTGVIDLDDAGQGELVEDLGLITGRLWTLARERGDETIERYVAGLMDAAAHHVPVPELRRRVGVSLLARATAPFRNQADDWRERALGRLAICEAWLDGR